MKQEMKQEMKQAAKAYYKIKPSKNCKAKRLAAAAAVLGLPLPLSSEALQALKTACAEYRAERERQALNRWCASEERARQEEAYRLKAFATVKAVLLAHRTRQTRAIKAISTLPPSLAIDSLPQAAIDTLSAIACRHGWSRAYRSDYGSAYLEKNGYAVRISDHSVPSTPEREQKWNARIENGQSAVAGWSEEIIAEVHTVADWRRLLKAFAKVNKESRERGERSENARRV